METQGRLRVALNLAAASLAGSTIPYHAPNVAELERYHSPTGVGTLVKLSVMQKSVVKVGCVASSVLDNEI